MKDLSVRKPGATDSTAAFHHPGKLRVYRIYKAGQRQPLYVGVVHGSGQSVAGRLRQHVSGTKVGGPTSETKQLHDELKKIKDLSQVLVRYGDIDAPKRFRHDPKFASGVEKVLTALLRPKFYDRKTTSFEEIEED